ncbi:MAG: SAM-dependent DNA methyltransferase [Fibrella sp.]|nr:SAM-dependent DNA methyltransferase [Armatimonadota bacterium]
MSAITEQNEINATLWRACDSFRGAFDSAAYKDYVLVMLFLKYISDVWRERKEELEARYGDNEEMLNRQLERLRFRLPERSSFDYLYSFASRDDVMIGEKIDIALAQIEEANYPKLDKVFSMVTFNAEALGDEKEKNRRLRNLLRDFANLDLRPSRVKGDIIGDAYMFLIERFASSAGKKGGEFYTPHGVSVLLAKLLKAKPGDRICDPTAGSGSLLLEVAREIHSDKRDYSLYGQEANGGTWTLCRLNMFLNGEDSAEIKRGDTLTNPLLVENDRLMKFNIVVANPPFSLDKWGADTAAGDSYKRFHRGVPPKSTADFAFLLHMIETALPMEGKVGVVVAHGVLFRGGAEGKIRQSLIAENLLDAVIGLPEKLFFGTGIPAAILIFDRSREAGGENAERNEVLFIDASKRFAAGKNQNTLRDDDIAAIAAAFHGRTEIARFSRLVPVDEIAANDGNLNIARYIDTFVAAESVDVGALQAEVAGLESELAAVRDKLNAHLGALGLG